MNWFLRVVTAPGDLITVAEAKAQARITSSYEDTLIGDYISAASAAIDGPYGMAGRIFGAQTWEYMADRLPQKFLIPVPGADTIVSFTYFDADDNSQTLTASDFYYVVPRDDGILMHQKDGAVLPRANERPDALTIRVSGGGTVPERIKHAALLTVAHWFDEREMGEVPMAAQHLINLERQGWVGA